MYAENNAGKSSYSNESCGKTKAPNTPPIVNAGPDQTIKLPVSTITLNGTISDDGLPESSVLSISWTQLSGPSSVVITLSTSLSTKVTFSKAGTYVLRLTGTDGSLSATDDIIVTVQPETIKAPFIVSISDPTETSLRVNFKDNADNETKTNIDRKIGNGEWQFFGSFGILAGTKNWNWINTGLNSNTKYCYRLRAINTSGASPYSNESCGTTKEKSILPLTITTPSPLPEGEVGKLYTQSFTAIGGQPSYSWPSYSGTLPSGLTAYSKGTLSGTPTKEGTYTFTLTVSDSSNPKKKGTKEFTVKIGGKAGDLVVSTDAVTNKYLRSVTLNGRVTSINNNIEMWFELVGNNNNSIVHWVKNVTTPTNLKFTLSNLTPDTSYTYLFAAKNSLGKIVKGNPVTFKTEKESTVKLGIEYNKFDPEIVLIANTYSIPVDLLKSIIHQEALKSHGEFEPRSYRYEAHIDHDWYSRFSSKKPLDPKLRDNYGWRGMGNYPEKDFTIGGKNIVGETINHGLQVPNDYLTWSKYTAGGLLIITDKDGNKNDITAAELVCNNPKQNWLSYIKKGRFTDAELDCKNSKSIWNFTAQLVLASSYGLGQTLYETAVNRGFDDRTYKGQNPARPVTDLFIPEVSLDLSAKHLAQAYKKFKDKNMSENEKWGIALEEYNRDPVYIKTVLDRWNNGNGVYKPKP